MSNTNDRRITHAFAALVVLAVLALALIRRAYGVITIEVR
jgi:hypothetical protein